MIRILIALLVHAVLVGTALAQGAGAVDPASLADGTQKALVQQYCDKDGRFMGCLGVDIKKDAARCADLVRGNWAFCRRTFMMTAPASIQASDARGYTDNLADCLRAGAVAAAGKSQGAVDQCMGQNR